MERWGFMQDVAKMMSFFLNGCIKPFTEKVHCIIIPNKIHYRVVIVGDNEPLDIVGKWEDTQPTTGEAVSDGGCCSKLIPNKYKFVFANIIR